MKRKFRFWLAYDINERINYKGNYCTAHSLVACEYYLDREFYNMKFYPVTPLYHFHKLAVKSDFESALIIDLAKIRFLKSDVSSVLIDSDRNNFYSGLQS